MTKGKSHEPGGHAASNIGPDGSYIVGKGKPPDSGKFRKGDGRKRGRRRKGTKDLKTDFLEEIGSTMTVSVNGKPRRVSKQRAIVMRLLDNASRGQPGAIKEVFSMIDQHVDEEDDRLTLEQLATLSEDELTFMQFAMLKASGARPEPQEEDEISDLLGRINLETIGWKDR